jgi:EAL domain-containing protein (putative c-di-GMP-specific phosphodiesterase class I)
VIEDHPLAVELGEWVIAHRADADRWPGARSRAGPAGQRQYRRAPAAAGPLSSSACRRARRASGVGPGELELEVLETSALEDLRGVSRVIEGLPRIGVEFALDDFGTGYSSLTYLKRLSVTQLKIDQSFVRDMLDDPTTWPSSKASSAWRRPSGAR